MEAQRHLISYINEHLVFSWIIWIAFFENDSICTKFHIFGDISNLVGNKSLIVVDVISSVLHGLEWTFCRRGAFAVVNGVRSLVGGGREGEEGGASESFPPITHSNALNYTCQ